MGAVQERRLISAVLRTGEISEAINRGVSADHFHNYRTEWDWMLERIGVTRKVPSKSDFKLAFPGFGVQATDDVDLYARAVVRDHAKALLYKATVDIADGLAKDTPPELLLQQLSKAGKDTASVIGAAGMVDGRLSDTRQFMAEVKRRYKAAQAGGLGIPFGFETLDDDVGGMMAGQVGVICSRPSVGKSWLLQRFALSAFVAGKRALIFSLEMNRFSVQGRLISLLSGLDPSGSAFDPSAIRKGTLGRSGILDLDKFVKEKFANQKGDIHIVDQSKGPISPERVQACIERFQPDVVFIDYLQLYARINSGSNSDLRLEVARHTSHFKELAESYRLPVWTASQFNRTGDSKMVPPGLSAIAESDSPGQDADVVLSMVPPSRLTIKAMIAKNREGPDGALFWVHKEPGQGIIQECTAEQAEELNDDEVVGA